MLRSVLIAFSVLFSLTINARENYLIGFSQTAERCDWRFKMEAEMKRELMFHDDLSIIIKQAEDINSVQIEQIRELVEMGIDLLIVSPNEIQPIQPVIEEVYRKGIPVILIDRRIDSEFYNAYVGGDNYEIGNVAANYIANKLNNKGKVVEIMGGLGISPAIERTLGFNDELKKYPELKNIKIASGWLENTIPDSLPDIMKKHPDIGAIYAFNDILANRASKVVKNLFPEREILIVGIDGLPDEGGGGVGDVGDVNFYEQYNLTHPDQGWMHPYTWENFYKSISRANSALRSLNELTDNDFAERTVRIAEIRFLRAHSHFMLKLIFKNIPYIDESLSNEDILQTSNTKYSNDELWNKIAEDFQFALDNLPEAQDQVGRANKYAAAAYLAKLRLYQAYEQNDQHKVTNINQSRLQEVVNLTEMVINSGIYSLQPDFGENFLDGYDNGPESIFAIQFSISDGTAVGRLSFVTGLNYPHGATQFGCCGFHAPSQNLVNAFSTDANGLPKFDTFNDVELSAVDITPGGVTVDPRIDHSVGIDGHPYKYRNEANYIFSNSWVRDPGVYGFFHSMKEQQAADCSCYKKEGPFIGTSKNIDVIRYADVLLMQAEAYIELGQQDKAMPLINEVRARAAQSTERTKKADGTPASNYMVSEYDGSNLAWTQENARKALQWERRLEFALESPRFFDLVRWGIADVVLNDYLAKEKSRRDFLKDANFTAGRDEYYPIPQREIDFTKGLYQQNPKY